MESARPWWQSVQALRRLAGPPNEGANFGQRAAVGWIENSPTAGEQWLRETAENGDAYAMERLGLRFLDGDGVATSPDHGIAWLRKAADAGNQRADLRLAEYLLDDTDSQVLRHEGEFRLRRAAAARYGPAKLVLGVRLITGAGLCSETAHGRELLQEASIAGSEAAHIKLATCLLLRFKEGPERQEALDWLSRIGVVAAHQISSLGFHLYLRSLTQSRREARCAATEAAVLFSEAARQEFHPATLSLAYLIRRGEVAAAEYPSLDALLQRHLEQRHPHAVVNEALRLARGVQCAVDWRGADTLIKRLRGIDRALVWWSARSAEGDAEGHVVTAWLCRHRLAFEPHRLGLDERLNVARRAGWSIPEWMDLYGG